MTARDAYNNTATGYSGTVTITSSDATFTSSPASGGLSAGSGSFSVTFNSSGTKSLGARDASFTAATINVTVSAAAAGSTYNAMSPVRVLDTRTGAGHAGKLGAKSPVSFQVAGQQGIPSNATAVTGNVTVVNSSSGWAVYLGPVRDDNPSTSNVNFLGGQVAGNGLTVALSDTGAPLGDIYLVGRQHHRPRLRRHGLFHAGPERRHLSPDPSGAVARHANAG